MSNKEYFDELTECNQIFTRITESDKIFYKVNRKLLKVLISQVGNDFLISSHGLRTCDEANRQRTGVRAAKYLDIETKDDKEEIFKRDRPELDEAIDYFIDNIAVAFAEALEDLLLEAVFKSLCKKTEKGNYILGITEKQFFKQLLDARLKLQERRIKAKKAPGDKKFWVLEKRQELLKFYNEKIEVIRAVKKDYKKCRDFKNWRETIKLQYPERSSYMKVNMRLKFNQLNYFCLVVSIVFLSVFLQLGCLKQKMPEECEQFYKHLSSNQREEIFGTYDLEKQLRLHRCGLDLTPMKLAYSTEIANRGKAIIPTLLNKLSTENDEVTKYGIILVFEMMSEKENLKEDKEVIDSIRNAISGMNTKWVKDYSQKSLSQIENNSQ